MKTPSASRVARALTRKLRTFLSAAVLVLVVLVLGVVGALFVVSAHATRFTTGPVPLGTADSFAVLAGTTVTNTGSSVITGDLGVSPGSACTGLPAPCTGGGPGSVSGGTIHKGDPTAASAQAALTTAYVDAAGRTPQTHDYGTTDKALDGLSLVPGIYGLGHAATANLSTTLTLDGQGDPNAVWIFQSSSDLVTGSSSHVTLINAAQSCHVYWQVTSSATLGTESTFRGTILALTSITVNTGVTIDGRALARNGAVTLAADTITAAKCAAAAPTPTPTAVPGNGGAGSSAGPANPSAPYGNTCDSIGGSVNTTSCASTNGNGASANGQPQSSGFPLWLAILLPTLSILLAGGGASVIMRNRMRQRME
jgi:hypothetical protein